MCIILIKTCSLHHDCLKNLFKNKLKQNKSKQIKTNEKKTNEKKTKEKKRKEKKRKEKIIQLKTPSSLSYYYFYISWLL